MMEEQSSVIADVVRNAQFAADRTKETVGISVAVSDGAAQTQHSAQFIDTAAGDLGKETTDLRGRSTCSWRI